MVEEERNLSAIEERKRKDERMDERKIHIDVQFGGRGKEVVSYRGEKEEG